ncbi:hypothetical protein SCLCIDRAFT_1126017 [Scleroderma citrinum Foug A]|uniref:Uncharacterized protein n=1 Tax=Scleroderma citrinum Foug A TaxID=1036808 RepID=A0A0C3DAG2_9AGAM|nr:hypothetical protein SCLCIDRAFT_1126017 [Scleroderma citrinum Foug A]
MCSIVSDCGPTNGLLAAMARIYLPCPGLLIRQDVLSGAKTSLNAEGRLDRRRLKRIKIEKELYDSISHEAGGELRAADANADWARGIRRLAGSVAARAREYEHVPSDRLDGGEMSVSDASDFNSEVEMHSIASECGPTNDSLAPHDPDIFPLAKSSDQTKCPVWRENLTRELPVSCPSPLASNPVKTGGDLDSQMPCLSALDSDLGFALVKAQRLERIAENISHEAGRDCTQLILMSGLHVAFDVWRELQLGGRGNTWTRMVLRCLYQTIQTLCNSEVEI